jgi:hypothetical protein
LWQPDGLENARLAAHIRGMQKTIDRVLVVIISVAIASMAAVTVGYVAHYDFGLSRQEIRTSALVGAIVIIALLAVEHFGKKLRRPK